MFARFLTQLRTYIPLVGIVVLAAGLRWFNLNWDNGFHLHPDERFLTMVQLDLKVPPSLTAYLDPVQSTLNPQNQGHAFYVYGMLPLTINKLIAVVNHTDTYDLAVLQGRFLSGLADVGTVLLIYSLASLVVGGAAATTKTQAHRVGLWAAALYAVAVLPIQLSHFFAVDSFLVFFAMAGLRAGWRYALNSRWIHLIQAGIFFGLALGCKLTALLMVPLFGALILTALVVVHGKWNFKFSWDTVLRTLLALGWWAILVYGTLRLASPHYFATANWLNFNPSPRFVENLIQLKSFEGDDVWFPPAIQWIHKPPVWFSLKNLVLYGVGLPWFGLTVLGVGVLGQQIWTNWRHQKLSVRDWLWFMLVGWMLVFFLYQSVQFAKVMRYFNLIYPGLALLAGVGLNWLLTQLSVWLPSKKSWLPYSLMAVMLLAILVWPAAFMGIYTQPHSRVTASLWMDQHLPAGSKILTEYWDDGLPLPLPNGKTFVGTQISVFDQDTPEKWVTLNDSFATADYYVLTSNRAWASIMVLPEKYPQMADYYRRLLAGQTEWQLVKTVTSYPSLRYLGIPIEFNTDFADEAFSVYDHPKVMIFAKPQHAGSLLGTQPLFASK